MRVYYDRDADVNLIKAKKVAVVGYPNVGKSSLVNRLTNTREAVVHERPGITRDRNEIATEWNGRRFLLIDTGGVDIADPSPITRRVAEQARAAIAEADLVLFVVDARAGVTPGDEELAQILRESKKDVLLLANKIDDPSQEALALDLHRLGFGEPFPISGLHGSNTGDLLDEVLDRLPGTSTREEHDEAIRVAILGRPNVGKSTLFNRIAGKRRALTHDLPGMTRDRLSDVVTLDDGRRFDIRHPQLGAEHQRSGLRVDHSAARLGVDGHLVDIHGRCGSAEHRLAEHHFSAVAGSGRQGHRIGGGLRGGILRHDPAASGVRQPGSAGGARRDQHPGTEHPRNRR